MIVKDLIQEVICRINRNLCIDRTNSLSDTFLLTSMGRSGSTLVANIIQSAGNARIYFEPFRPEKVPQSKPFFYGQYLLPSSNKIHHLQVASKLLNGDVYNSWISRGSTSFAFDKRIIKTIRANTYIPWLKYNFPDIKLIILIRNPFAVVHSWLRMNFGTGNKFKKNVLKQPAFVDLLPKDAVRWYKDAESPKLLLLFQWCIQYYVVFHHLKPSQYHLILFENLLSNPEKEINNLYSYLGLSKNRNWERIISKPSRTTHKDSQANINPGKVSENWKSEWSSSELNEGNKIIKLFNLQKIYSPIHTKPDHNPDLKRI